MSRNGQYPSDCVPCQPSSAVASRALTLTLQAPPALPVNPNSIPVVIDPSSILQLLSALSLAPPIRVEARSAESPPPDARIFHRYALAVIAPPTAGADSSATDGAAELARAQRASRFASATEDPQVLTPASVSEAVSLFAEPMQDTETLRLTHFGCRVHCAQRAIRFSLDKDGVSLNVRSSGGGTSDFEFNEFGDPAQPLPIFAVFGPRQTVRVTARNLDVRGGYLIESLLLGYTYRASPGVGGA